MTRPQRKSAHLRALNATLQRIRFLPRPGLAEEVIYREAGRRLPPLPTPLWTPAALLAAAGLLGLMLFFLWRVLLTITR